MENELKKSTLAGLTWKFIENFGTQLINFVIQVVLARLLLPEDYGIIALTSVFIIIANVFIQTGFTSALIQKKEINDVECSSVFFSGMGVSIVLYLALFFASPMIADYYKEPLLIWILRAQSLGLIFGGLTSVHNALLTRNLQFKKSFKKSLIAIIVQGAVGITLATLGYGVWALVCANVVNYLVGTIILWRIVDWKPKRMFSFQAIKKIFPFSSRILVISLANALFQNIKSLIIGKAYNKSVLGYYNRGYQIPTLIMTNVDGAINSVMFPVLSKCQDDKERLISVLRRSLRTSCYLVFPLMIGLFAVAKPLTSILLTDKWLPSVPFMQITCLICLMWPFSIRYQAFNAIGKSGISLKIDIFSKAVTVILLIVSFQYGVYMLIISELVSSLISNIYGSIVISRTLKYTIRQQLIDILPTFILTAVMGVIVWCLQYLIMNNWLLLFTQVVIGISVYVCFSILFKFETFKYLFGVLKDLLANIRKPR